MGYCCVSLPAVGYRLQLYPMLAVGYNIKYPTCNKFDKDLKKTSTNTAVIFSMYILLPDVYVKMPVTEILKR